MLEWLESNGWAIWLALALALGAVEVATADLVFLMLVGGALAGAVAAALTVGLTGQVITAVVVAIALLAVVRPFAKRKLDAGHSELKAGVDAYIGGVGVVTETVTAEQGRVRLDGEVWSARLASQGIPAPEGSSVHVTDIDGVTLLVSAVPPVQDSLEAADPD